MSKKPELILLGTWLLALAALMAIIAIPALDSTPNDGKTGTYMVYDVRADPYEESETRDGDWRIDVHEKPTPAKAKPEEIVISTEDRDYLVYGDILTLKEGVVVDIDYMDVTDAPGGDRRKDVMTPYSERVPEIEG